MNEVQNEKILMQAEFEYGKVIDKEKDWSFYYGSLIFMAFVCIATTSVLIWGELNNFYEVDKDDYEILVENYGCETHAFYEEYFFDDGKVTGHELIKIPTLEEAKAKNFILGNETVTCDFELKDIGVRNE